jgi:hypothetical protein
MASCGSGWIYPLDQEIIDKAYLECYQYHGQFGLACTSVHVILSALLPNVGVFLFTIRILNTTRGPSHGK